MVYEPGKHKGPTTVPNSYIITTAQDASFLDMVKEVEALIKKEGKEDEFKITNKMMAIGTAFIHCDKAFADKIKHLPYVGSVDPEHRAYIQKKKGPGAGI